MEHFNPILGNDTPGQKFITCGEIMPSLVGSEIVYKRQDYNGYNDVLTEL